MAMQQTEKRDGRLSLLAFGGLFGQKGSRDVLRTSDATIQKFKMNCLALCCFWCKKELYTNGRCF